MKLSIAVIVIIGLISIASAVPVNKRMVYYQHPAGWPGVPQRLMYVQHVQPSPTYARSTQAAEALVAGQTVATGTYLEDCNHAESDVATAGSSISADSHVSQSVAEAYPDEVQTKVELEPVADEETEVKTDDESKVPRELNINAEQEPEAPESQNGEPGDESVAAPEKAPAKKPTVPVKRYWPAKKKVIVELERPSAEEDEEALVEDEEGQSETVQNAGSDEEQEVPVAPKKPVQGPSARRPTATKPKAASQPKPLPAGTFFPIDFGGTNGGAIAIANAFSTGEGGSATSHATAYGSPEAARGRVRPSKYH